MTWIDPFLGTSLHITFRESPAFYASSIVATPRGTSTR